MNSFRLLNATLRWFLFAMILANIASEMVFALLPVYLSDLHADAAQIGLVFSAASIVPLALQIFGGWLSDSIGRLRTIAIGSACATLGYLGFALAPTWEWVILALGLEYISGALVGPSFGAFIADQSAEENRGRVFGLSKGIFMVVIVIGPALAGVLAQNFGFRFMMLVAFVMYASAAILRIWMATTTRFSEKKDAEPLTWRSFHTRFGMLFGMLTAGGLLTWILITDGVRDVAYTLSGDLQPLYFSTVGKLSVEQIGWLRSVLGLCLMISTLVGGWLSDRRGERPVIVAGFLLQFVGFAIFLQSNSFPGFLITAIIIGIGFGLMIPAYDSLVSKAMPDKMRGMVFGLFYTSLGLISLPAPWLGGQLWKRFNPRVPFLITALAVLISVIPAWFKFVLPKTDQEIDNIIPE